MTSTASTGESAPWEDDEPVDQMFEAPGFSFGHPAEPDLFVRQLGVPGHDQAALERARIVMAGAGGLGSWTGLGLVRSGVRDLTVIDPDRFDRSNAHRQLMFPGDLGKPKASALARNLVPHMVGGGSIRAINLLFEEALEQDQITADVLLVLVDNNRCRLAGSRWARQKHIPAVFAMLSLDGVRMQCFLQGPSVEDACLWCALPNLDPNGGVPCAAASVAICLSAAARTVFLAYRAIAGSLDVTTQNWHDQNLESSTLGGHKRVSRRQDCAVCLTSGDRKQYPKGHCLSVLDNTKTSRCCDVTASVHSALPHRP